MISFTQTSASELQDLPLLSIFDSYISYYASGTGNTARAKRLDLSRFLDFLQLHRRRSSVTELLVRDWDLSATTQFIDDCLRRGEAPATVTRRLATIKHMGRALAERVAGFINPARDARPPKLPTTRPKALSEAQLQAVFSRAHERLAEKPGFVRNRNLMLLELLLDTGLRAEEVRLLKRSQLSDDLEWIHRVRTKGRRFRNVYITSPLRPKLALYLAAREEELAKLIPRLSLTRSKALPVFVSCYKATPSEPDSFLMGAKSVWRAIRELSQEFNVHPHLLRHSFAHELLDSSGDIRLVSQALGHSDLRVTMKYTERTDIEVAEALEKSRAGSSKRKR